MIKFSEIKKIKRVNEDQFSTKSLAGKEIEGVEEIEGKEVTKYDPAKFFSKLFESREMAHIYHLQVRGDEGSFAAHKALNDYYDGVLGLIDELIEVYTGQYEIVESYDVIDTSTTKSKDKIEYFIELAQFIKDTRNMALSEEDTHLQNIVDEVVALVYKTLYKLRFNK